MRLIDADALTEDFKGRIEPCDKWIKEANEETKPRAEAIRAFINEVILTIQDAPTIEPDRPHGEWEKKTLHSEYFYCSECKYAYRHAFNFCPNCGSDNRKKVGDAE